MKMKKEHYNHIKDTINSFYPKPAMNKIKQDYKKSGLSDMRFRWDIFHSINLSHYACDTLYPYLNDDHIDTALRHILKD